MSRKPQTAEADRLRLYQDYGVDITTRTVRLYADIEEATMDRALTGIDFLEGVNNEPIKLIVSTYGGSEVDMFAITDVMKASDCIFETVATAKCMSAGPLIVAAGDTGYRWAHKSCQMMLHIGGAMVPESTLLDQASHLKWAENMHETWLDLMADYTDMPRSFWDKMCKEPADRFFTSEDALEWGIVDGII